MVTLRTQRRNFSIVNKIPYTKEVLLRVFIQEKGRPPPRTRGSGYCYIAKNFYIAYPALVNMALPCRYLKHTSTYRVYSERRDKLMPVFRDFIYGGKYENDKKKDIEESH